MDRVPNPQPHLQHFDPRRQLLDPYAKALTGGAGWGIPPRGRRSPRRRLVVRDAFDWGEAGGTSPGAGLGVSSGDAGLALQPP